MDGNARWARKRGLPIAAGHRAGTKALRRTVEAAIDLGVESLAVYAFSTENWNRPPEEVELLMEIFTETIERELPDLVRQWLRSRPRPSAMAGSTSGSRSTTVVAPRSSTPPTVRYAPAARSTRRRSRRTSTRPRCP